MPRLRTAHYIENTDLSGFRVLFIMICQNLSRFTRPGGGHELFEVTNSIANAGSFEMHPAIEAM
jgi:hypothetical protein